MLITYANHHTSTYEHSDISGSASMLKMPNPLRQPWRLQGLITAIRCCTIPHKWTSTSYSVSRICWLVRWFKHVNTIMSLWFLQNYIDCHWKPEDSKIALMTFNVLTIQQPYYLFELLQLRSSQHSQLDTNRTCTVFADRAFSNAAPSVWNSLPLYITDNFNSLAALKTYYYCLYFWPCDCMSVPAIRHLWLTYGTLNSV